MPTPLHICIEQKRLKREAERAAKAGIQPAVIVETSAPVIAPSAVAAARIENMVAQAEAELASASE